LQASEVELEHGSRFDRIEKNRRDA
jgi:hypothetical protein